MCKIPTEIWEKIDTLLNDRLNHETTNHNDLAARLTPDNKCLSSEHREIRAIMLEVRTQITVAQAEQKARFENLTSDQRDIKKYIEAVYQLEKQMEHLQTRNRALHHEVVHLQSQLSQNNKQSRSNDLGQDADFDY